MAVVVTHNFEVAPAGTDVAQTTNYGAAVGTPITLLAKAGAATIKFQPTGKAHGAFGMQVVCAGGTDSYRVRWDFTANTGGMATARFYFTLQALPSQAQDFALIVSSSGQVKVGLMVGNTLRLSDLTGVTIGTASPVLTAGTTYRVEAQYKKGTTTTDGQAAMQVYVGDSTTTFHSTSSTTTNTGTADWVQWHFGEATAGRTINITFDDLALDNTTQTALGRLIETVPAPRIRATAVMRASNF